MSYEKTNVVLGIIAIWAALFVGVLAVTDIPLSLRLSINSIISAAFFCSLLVFLSYRFPSDNKKHRNDILNVYQKWTNSYVDRLYYYRYGNISLGMAIDNLPDKERYYSEAREDLECYPREYDSLQNAEEQIKKANAKGKTIADDVEREVSGIIKQCNPNASSKTRGQGEPWYALDTIIPHLILKPIVKGDKYKIPDFFFRPNQTRSQTEGAFRPQINSHWGAILSEEEGVSFAGELTKEEAEKLIPVIAGLPTLATKISERVKDLQSELDSAEKAYVQFKKNLEDDVIKMLDSNKLIPNRGKCKICLSSGS